MTHSIRGGYSVLWNTLKNDKKSESLVKCSINKKGKAKTKVFSTPPHLTIQLHKNNPKKLWSIRTSAAQIPIKSQHFVLRNTIYQRTIWATNSSSKDGQLMLYWQDSIAFTTEIKHDSLYFDTADYTCTISVASDSAPVISNNLKTYHNKDLVKKSWDSSCEKSWVPVQNQWVPVQKTMSAKLKMPGHLRNQTVNLKTVSKTLYYSIMKLNYSPSILIARQPLKEICIVKQQP